MKVVFMGTPDFAVNILQGLIDNYEVIGVVSQPDKRVGRHLELKETPIKKLALENNIKVFQPEKIKLEYSNILELNPDIIITCAYGQIIPKEILDYPKYGCINVHASLLPKYRGGAPIHKAIIDGEKETGITIMYMDEGMDTGDIISQEAIPILDSDNLETIHDKLSILGTKLLLETLPSIFGETNTRLKQDPSKVTYAYNIKREEEHIDFNKTSREVFNLIRGLSPIPSSYAILFNEEMKILESKISDKTYNGVCGEIVEINKEGIVVKTKDSAVVLTKVKPFGKKTMDAYSYVNGISKDKLLGEVFS